MTFICKNCGCENHLEASECTECGQPINKNEVYVVCTTCGISNPQSAKTCIGCGETLSGTTTFVIENEVVDDNSAEEVLSFDSAGVVKKEKKVKVKKKLTKLKKLIVPIMISVVTITGLLVVFLTVLGNQNFYEAEEGFFYVTETGILHIVDEKGKDIEVGYDVKDPEVYKYGKEIYYLTNQELYHYSGFAKLIAAQVSSFKVSHNGKDVLYTVDTNTEGLGDLFRYDGKEITRIDGSVGLNRYIFGLKDDVYYVSEITEDENLGVLYMKRADKAPIKVASDVYEPLFSLRKDSVYYVRKSIDDMDRFDLFYVKNGSVTEVSRNVTQLHVNPSDETFILIQYKNNEEHLFSVMRNESTELKSGIDKTGILMFGDAKPLQFRENLTLMLHMTDGTNQYYKGDITLLSEFDDFKLSGDTKKIFTIKNNELFRSDFNGQLSNTTSLLREVELVSVSHSGEKYLYNDDMLYYSIDNNTVIAEDATEAVISVDEKYLIYLKDRDAYTLKNEATEPVFLGANVDFIMNQGSYVFTVIEKEIFRYKLGKFSSNKSIAKMRQLATLKLTK